MPAIEVDQVKIARSNGNQVNDNLRLIDSLIGNNVGLKVVLICNA